MCYQAPMTWGILYNNVFVCTQQIMCLKKRLIGDYMVNHVACHKCLHLWLLRWGQICQCCGLTGQSCGTTDWWHGDWRTGLWSGDIIGERIVWHGKWATERQKKRERQPVCEGSQVYYPLGARIQSASKQGDVQHSGIYDWKHY